MNKTELELAGAILYKCEGTKLRKDKRYLNGNTFYYAIEFTNSDPELIKLFLEFLRKIIKIDESKIKCEIFGYPDLNIVKLENFWSKITKIPLANFQKTILIKRKNFKFKPNPWGTCKIRYSNKESYKRLNQVIINNLGNASSLIK